MKWFFISISALVVIICSIIIFVNKEDSTGPYSKELNKIINKKIKYDKLIKIDYDKSGDMIGSLESIRIDITKKELTYRHSSAHYEPISVEVYKISDDDINDLNNKIKEYNLPAWSKLKKSDMVVYDAASESIKLNYKNSTIGGDKIVWYTISFDSKIPLDGYPLLRNFKDLMYQLIKSNNLIKEYIEEE